MEGDYWHLGGFAGLVVRAFLRTLQFIFAVVVAVLYGLDLHGASKARAHADASWVYAEVVAATSILTCIVHLFYSVTRAAWCLIDWVLVVFWSAQLGVFGSMYLGNKEPPSPDFKPARSRMAAAVWIDLVSMLLWIATGTLAVMNYCARRKSRKRVNQKMASDEVELEDNRLGTSSHV